MDFFAEIIDWLIAPFSSPEKRVFIGYLLMAFAIALIWLWLVQGKGLRAGLKSLFSKDVWWSRSSRADYALLFINRAVMTLLSPVLLGQLAVATFLFESLHHVAAPSSASDWAPWLAVSFYTALLFVLDDFSRFAIHAWMHRWHVLWRFHQVHHSAMVLTPLTIFRTHPMEGVLFSLRSALVQGICIALVVFLFGRSIDLMTVLGANVVVFVFNVTGANLRHSHIPIAYPHWLERWLISPAQHQIHHSIAAEHYDRNFGVVLAVWDRLYGSLHHSESGRELIFGLDGKAGETTHALSRLYLAPVIGERAYNWLRKVFLVT